MRKGVKIEMYKYINNSLLKIFNYYIHCDKKSIIISCYLIINLNV